MKRFSRFRKGPFAAGITGGAIVAVLGWVALTTGLVKAESGSQVPAAPTSTLAANSPQQSGNRDASAQNLSAGQVYQQDSGAVAYIEAEQQPSGNSGFGVPSGNGGTATGSGFLIDDQGHVLTNAHVVDGASSVTVKLGDGDTLNAKVLGADQSTDVAVLQVDASKINSTPLELGSSSAANVGDPVVAIGNPFGLDRTVTTGIVSALQRSISAPDGFTISNVIQTDAAINPGNSGGPLINGAGQVVGINSQIATDKSGGATGIGFAIPINTAKDVASQLIDNGQVQHAYLGVSGTDLTAGIAKTLNLGIDSGALIQQVTPDGPAAKAGIEVGKATMTVDGAQVQGGGDVVTAVDGQKITGMDDLVAAINGDKPGDQVTLTVYRGGQSKDLTATLANRPAQANG